MRKKRLKSLDLLRSYQHRMIDHIRRYRCCALWVDMGLGKTVATLTALQEMKRDFEVTNILVIAPLRVCQMVWPREPEEWEHLHLTVSVAAGKSISHRILALQNEADIHVINRENMDWLVKQYKDNESRWKWDCVVIDESSSFKTQNTKRFRALRRVLPYITTLIELTGTPTPNGVEDLWSQMYLLDQGTRLGKTLTSFRNRWMHLNPWSPYRYTPRLNAVQEIKKLTEDICLSLKAEDYFDLPATIENEITVELSPLAQRKYNDMKSHCLIELQGTEITAVSSGTVWNKLCQLANGAVYTGEEREWVRLHNHKLDALTELLGVISGPVIIVYVFRHDLERIQGAFKAHGVNFRLLRTQQDEDDWNEGKYDRLVLHPASAGHGLNLHKSGCKNIIWYGLTPNLEHWMQTNARITGGHRAAGGKSTTIHRIVALETQDRDLYRALQSKAGFQSILTKNIKRMVLAEGVAA